MAVVSDFDSLALLDVDEGVGPLVGLPVAAGEGVVVVGGAVGMAFRYVIRELFDGPPLAIVDGVNLDLRREELMRGKVKHNLRVDEREGQT